MNNNIEKKIITAPSVDVCEIYLNYLNEYRYQNEAEFKGPRRKKYKLTDNLSECCNILNDYLDQFNFTADRRNKLISEMENDYKNNQVPPVAFEWLKNNQRACCYIWQCIRYQKDKSDRRSLYLDLGLNQHPKSHQERLACIKQFFERWNTSLPTKEDLFDRLKYDWNNIVRDFPDPFSWIEDKNNDIQKNWAREYLINYIQLKDQSILENEIYLSLYSIFDNYLYLKDSKELLLIRMKHAWAQYNLREKNKDKKPINVYLTKKAKNELDVLMVHYNKNMATVLEILIKTRYNQLEDIKKKN